MPHRTRISGRDLAIGERKLSSSCRGFEGAKGSAQRLGIGPCFSGHDTSHLLVVRVNSAQETKRPTDWPGAATKGRSTGGSPVSCAVSGRTAGISQTRCLPLTCLRGSQSMGWMTCASEPVGWFGLMESGLVGYHCASVSLFRGKSWMPTIRLFCGFDVALFPTVWPPCHGFSITWPLPVVDRQFDSSFHSHPNIFPHFFSG